ncbi:hypothetical protein [Mycobacterium kansasii]|uniref:hypothetical protein n=1 Tax=Mycobacterium kansasii TaxID=1768 RepID=UPI000C07290E|nr:hypothetical protein [Mycobacterium kansasii]VAZ67460.1 hypothetical protein LAUMK40_03599 [Mycobacterium kansasii]VAZ76870.1 hypothetical protein LAUMK7_03558 [Mycobacterium kansasii]
MSKPELSAPKLAKPDAVPVPALKNPDDGLVVELPNPGAPPMSMIVQSAGPRLADTGMTIAVEPSGLPIWIAGAGPVAEIGGMVSELTVPCKTGMGPSVTVVPNGMSSIVIPW